MNYFLQTTALLLLTTLLVFGGCDDSDDSSSGDGGPDESCTTSDGGGDGDMCYMTQEEDSSFQMTCELFGGGWDNSPCDPSLYVRQCIEETEVSNDGGNTYETVHYVYYYAEGSTTSCFGEETEL